MMIKDDEFQFPSINKICKHFVELKKKHSDAWN